MTRHIAVVGAGMTGLTAAVLLARAGHQVTLLDADVQEPPASPEASWEAWSRPGVSQFRQPHLMLPRWTQEIHRELPELLDDLVAGGAAHVNLLHLQPVAATQGWQPGDEDFDTVTARRPVLEAALARLAYAEPGVTVRRGARVTGPLVRFGKRCPRVLGVRTTDAEVRADLTVDATGRHTRFARWVRSWNGPGPVTERADCGFVYYARHFRRSGPMPEGRGPVLTHHPSLSLLTLPGDLDTFCLVLVTSSRDRALRALRDEAAWSGVAELLPAASPWLRAGTPTSGVMPLAGIEDVTNSYVREGRPVVTGLLAIGDAAAATNPSLGRGAALGVLQACALRDALSAMPAADSRDPHELVLAVDALIGERVAPWVELTHLFDRHRLAEMDADVAGTPYLTSDPSWRMTTALLAGAAEDADLARAAGRISGMVASPAEVLSAPGRAARVVTFADAPRYAASPTRADLLAALTRAAGPPLLAGA